MRKHHLLAVLLLSVFVASARADQLYTFSFTQTGGQIESFAVSFTVPTFVTTGQSPSFTPFTLTDGTHSVTLTEDLAVQGAAFGDFEFDTPTDASLAATGGITWNPPAGGAVIFELSSLPTTDGTYDPAYGGGFYYGASSSDVEDLSGTAQLTISQTPEPSSVILLLTTLLAVALMARKRIAQGL